MAESEGESDFASAESEQEEEEEAEMAEEETTDKVTSQAEVRGRPKEGTDEEKEREGGGTEREEMEAAVSVGERQEEERERAVGDDATEAVSSSTPAEVGDPIEPERPEGERTLKEDESKGEEVTEREGSTAVESSERAQEGEPQLKAPAPTEGGGGGGWGVGRVGEEFVVFSVNCDRVSSSSGPETAISTVEDALGLPSPQQLAAKGEEEGEGEGERGGEGERQGEEGDENKEVETLAKMSEKALEDRVDSSAPQSLAGPSSSPEGPQVEPESAGDQGKTAAAAIGSFSGFFSGIATAVEQRGLQIMSGGLDALENIGKKTMEVLTEGDPGFQNKRKLLKGEAPSLSALLREAKAEAEAKQNEAEATGREGQSQQSYSALFDEYQGVIHLEALELLSKEYAAKVRGCLPSLSGEEGEWVEQQMELVAQTLTIREEGEGLAVLDDDSGKLGEIVELFSDMTPTIKVEKLVNVSNFWREKLEGMSVSHDLEIHQIGEGEGREGEKEREGVEGEGGEGEKERGGTEGEQNQEGAKEGEGEKIETGEEVGPSETDKKEEKKVYKVKKEEVYTNGLRGLVQLTSASIELFRKMAEVSLLPQATKADTIGRAKRFNRLTVLVSSELDALASVHAELLTELGLEDVNATITALYMESSNSVSYVQDALQLLRPVLQYTVLQEVALNQPSRNVHSRS